MSEVQVRQPSLTETKGGDHLLIWSDIPFWMVADTEILDIIRTFKEPKEVVTGFKNYQITHPGATWEQFLEVLRHLEKNHLTVGSGNPESGTNDLLENVTINITNRCNLRCLTCYNQPLDHGKDSIGTEEIERLLDSLGDRIKEGATFAILGGEPLIVPELTLKACRIAKDRGMVPIISTNGTLVTKEIARELRRNDVELQVSLDGATAGTNDRIRGAGTFEKVRKNFAVLVKNKVHTILSMVVCQENFHELGEFMELSRKWGASEVRFIPMKRIGLGETGSLTPPSLEMMVKAGAEALKKDRKIRRKLLRDYFSILAYQCTVCMKRESCGVGIKTVFMDADGSLYPCPNLCYPRFRFGSVHQDPSSILKAWESSGGILDVRESYCVDSVEPCSECEVRYWCGGGCRGESFSVHGKLGLPSANCKEGKEAIKQMMWTLSEMPDLKRGWAKEEHF
ncbi:MAG: radical SAM protein [Thermoplasmatota archaeon]